MLKFFLAVMLLVFFCYSSAAKAGTAASFTAASSGAIVAEGMTTPINNNNSVVAYINISSTTAYKGWIAGTNSPNADNPPFAIGFGNSTFDNAGDNPILYYVSNGWVASTLTIPINTWVLYVGTAAVSGANVTYLSTGPGGSVNSTSASSSFTPGGACVSIGASDEGASSCGTPVLSRYATAEIAKVAVFGSVLSSANVNTLAACTTDSCFDTAIAGFTPIGYWKLQDNVGSSTAADSSGNSYTGTVINGGSGVVFGVTGPLSSGYSAPNNPVIIGNDSGGFNHWIGGPSGGLGTGFGGP